VGLDRFDYGLPEERIAQSPVEPREAARLLVAVGGSILHRTVADLPELLEPGDVLVVNETRVLPARLRVRKQTGGAVEVLLLEELAPGTWEALVRPGRRVAPGTVLEAEGRPVLTVGEDVGEGRRHVTVLDAGAVEALGTVPLPPYITRPLEDPERYQTVYARKRGSVAAPTAGLHLTEGVLERCRARGVEVATVDLAVGLATFRPMATTIDDHVMHGERYDVPPETMAACQRARRVVAVGTTTVRALESAAHGELSGRTELFIRPGYEFSVVDVLLTNFHLPRSSLLVLLAAFCGERWRLLYDVALAESYRFLSFGDCMLVDRS
jgi:S-adenosylmethionine:tRNA ribosyltransferase-isomerase